MSQLSLLGRIANVVRRRAHYFSRLRQPAVPVQPLAYLPDGFEVHRVAQTGLSVVDHFCTRDEAEYLIEKAKGSLIRSYITINNKPVHDNYRTSSTACLYAPKNMDPRMLPLLYRGAMLLGLPDNNVETVFVTRYGPGEYYKAHEDFYPGFHGDRLYTILIYLNDLAEDQGGGTAFEQLNVAVRPKLGRAVIWTNTNPDGSGHPETRHEALPLAEGAEKWVVQLWYRRYGMLPHPAAANPAPQAAAGVPLVGNERLPAGVTAPGVLDMAHIFPPERQVSAP